MPIELSVMRDGKIRAVPVRFVRAGGGFSNVDSTLPDIDDRGHRGPSFGPIMGVAMGRRVRVEIERVTVPLEARLVAVSSDNTVFVVRDVASPPPPGGTSPPSAGSASAPVPGPVTPPPPAPPVVLGSVPSPAVLIDGLDGGTGSRTARLEIRVGTATGPVIGALEVNVFVIQDLHLTLHRAQLNTAGAGPGLTVRSVTDINSLVSAAADVWIHYGVRLVPHWHPNAISQHPVGVAGVLRVSGPALTTEFGGLLKVNRVPHTCNVYFVPALRRGSGATATFELGDTWSPLDVANNPNLRPGVVIADPSAAFQPTPNWGVVLAHELGHFMTLKHVGNQNVHVDSTAYALRNVMHNFNPPLPTGNWPTNQAHTRARRDDHGYGSQQPGGLVTMKSIRGVANDNQVQRIRARWNPPGPY